MSLVVNLFGGPNRGKSTTASGLFYQLKIAGYNCELVTEYAKDLTFEERKNILKDQVYILAKQNRRLERLRNKVDVIITDSPLILGLMYKPSDYYKFYEPLAIEMFNSYDNINFYLTSSKGLQYQKTGRDQTKEEAELIDNGVRNLLDNLEIDYDTMDIDPDITDGSNLFNFIEEINKRL